MRRPLKHRAHRRQPSQTRAQETVNSILDTVILLLKRGGAGAITTNRIAERAGVSIGSVYQYFPNKQGIFIALHERHTRQVDQVLLRKINQSAGEPLDCLITFLLDGMIEVHASDPELSSLLDSEVPHQADGGREFSVRLHETLRRALAPHAESLGGAVKLHARAFVLGNMLEALGHAVVLRRPPGMSLRYARREAARAILASLQS